MARNRQRAKQRRARREAQGITTKANSRAEEPIGPSEGLTGSPAKTDAVAEAVVSASTPTAEEISKREKAASADAKPAKGTKAAPAPEKQKGRFMAFLRSSAAELRRVQWPDRRQVTTLTSIVIGFVIIAGIYLGVIDWVASQIVDQTIL